MNILIDGRPFVKASSGIPTFLQGSLYAWARLRPKDRFIIALPSPIHYSLKDVCFPPNVEWRISKNVLFHKLPNLIWLCIMMPILCRLYHVDIYYSALPCIPFFLRKKTKTVIVVHDVVNIEYRDTMEWSNRLSTWLFFSRSIRKADFLWANSMYTKSCVEKYYPKRRCENVFVGCSVNRDVYHPVYLEESTKELIKEKFGIVNRFVLYVGSLEPRKNLSFMLSLMPAIWQDMKIQLLVVGAKRWKESSIFNVVNREDFPKGCVSFCGYVTNEELAMLYNMAECYISTSLNEGFGMPQLEAFLCGCPVVTAANSAMREIAEGKSGSLIISDYQKAEWIEKIEHFIVHHDNVEVQEFANYDWNNVLSSFCKLVYEYDEESRAGRETH